MVLQQVLSPTINQRRKNVKDDINKCHRGAIKKTNQIRLLFINETCSL